MVAVLVNELGGRPLRPGWAPTTRTGSRVTIAPETDTVGLADWTAKL